MVFTKIHRTVYKKFNLTNQILAVFWGMLTKLDSNGIIYNEEKVTASIQSFWSISSIITREVEEIEHLRGITGSGDDERTTK